MDKLKFFKKIALLTAFSCALTVSGSTLSDIAWAEAAVQTNQGCVVAQRTEEEIKEYIKKHPFDLYASPTYAVEPDLSNNIIGKLSGQTLQNSINALNAMRYIAGLSEVELDDDYIELTQAASFVNCANNVLLHTPSKPSGVSDEIYEMGYMGASHSNIAMGYINTANSVVYGYMEDSDLNNVGTVGHRRWCLNPTMTKTGFGQVGRYSAMYAFDGSVLYFDEYNVSWPAQKMPVQYFGSGYAWSLSTGKYLDPDAVKVTLTRKSDSKKWNFSANKSDGYFNVENSYYGQMGCVIFRPDDIVYKAGDSFSIVIETGADTISYNVDFFSLVNYGDINGDGKITTVDAKWVLQAVSGSRTLTPDQKAAADVNGDGNITTVDAKWILQAVSGSRTL